MDKFLGIDYGKKKVGLAISFGFLATPFQVLKYKNFEILFTKLKAIAEKHKIKKIIVGVSEGESEAGAREFGNKISSKLNIPVVFVDETLTTLDAQKMALEANIKSKKRKGMEDAFAATLILQKYLDSM